MTTIDADDRISSSRAGFQPKGDVALAKLLSLSESTPQNLEDNAKDRLPVVSILDGDKGNESNHYSVNAGDGFAAESADPIEEVARSDILPESEEEYPEQPYTDDNEVEEEEKTVEPATEGRFPRRSPKPFHRYGMSDLRDYANVAEAINDNCSNDALSRGTSAPIGVKMAEACVAVTDIHPQSEELGDPLSYDAILNRPDKEQWLAAHALEHEAQMKNGTYEIVPKSTIPPKTRLLTWKDVYKLKLGPDGRPVKYKARFTIRGCAQSPDQYGDITAHVFSMRSLRVICALVAHFDWEFKSLDVDSAFLQGDLKQELYAVAPKGLGIPSDHAVKLKKTIYGLMQAGHEWQKTLFRELESLKYIALRWSDRCIFIRKLDSGRILIIMVYVDDIPYAYDKRDEAVMLEDVKKLMSRFPMKDLGNAEYILGWRITRDRAARQLTLDQQGNIQHILEEYGMTQCRPQGSPGTALSVLHRGPSTGLSEVGKLGTSAPALKHDQVELKDYRAIVGALQYLACCTLPVIADAVNKLAQFSAEPQIHHLEALKKANALPVFPSG